MNVKRLRETVAAIRADVKAAQGKWMPFDMPYFIKETECGTVCCLAGKRAIMDGNKNSESRVDDAAKSLGLTNSQAAELFYLPSWNEKFQTQYRRARTGLERVRALEGQVEYMIRRYRPKRRKSA